MCTLDPVTLVIPINGWKEILRCVTHALLPMPGFNLMSGATFSCVEFMGNTLTMCLHAA